MKPHDKKAMIIRRVISYLQLLLLVGIVVGVPLYVWLMRPELIDQVNSLEKAEFFLQGYKNESYVIYLMVQVVQIVVSVIPGQFMNMAAGWLFTFPIAFALSVAGAAIGTFITYYMSRLLGHKAVKTLIEPEKYQAFLRRLNSKRAYIAVFVLYLFPGLPKDILGYVAGVSNMRFLPFLVLSLVGRMPALAVSVMVGSMLNKEIYTGVVILSLVMITLFTLGIVYRKKVLYIIDHGYAKYIQKEGK
jgi:uncharacterized membrane protein YdjX (TVP38/TMEM64 family)